MVDVLQPVSKGYEPSILGVILSAVLENVDH